MDDTLQPTQRLAEWVAQITAELGWEGSVDADGFCAFAAKDGASPVVVQADDSLGIIRYSSEVLASVEPDASVLSELLTANFRGIATGIGALSLNPVDNSVHYELVWTDSDRGGSDRFALLLDRVVKVSAMIRQAIAQKRLPEFWAQATASSSSDDSPAFGVRV